MNPSFNNGSWVDAVKLSLPEHASDLEKNLENVMTKHGLDELEAHGVALAAAIASGNGELAFEISMNGPLFGSDDRQLAIKSVIAQSINSTFATFSRAASRLEYETIPSNIESNPLSKEEETKYEMFSMAAALVSRYEWMVWNYMELLKLKGYTDEQLRDIADIVCVVSAINKVVL
jgi:hypothetical protein